MGPGSRNLDGSHALISGTPTEKFAVQYAPAHHLSSLCVPYPLLLTGIGRAPCRRTCGVGVRSGRDRRSRPPLAAACDERLTIR